MKASIKTISPIYLVLLIPIIGLLIFANTIRISDIDTWSIGKTSTINAQILWQKNLSCLTSGYTTSHGAIAVSKLQIIFHYGCIPPIDGHFVALNLQTGDLEWKSRGEPSFQVIGVEDGYLVVNGDSYIGKLDYRGNSIWESEKFPSRAVRAIYVKRDTIYAPFETRTDQGVYLLSQQTGQITNSIRDKNAVVSLNTVNVNWLGDNQIEIIDNRNEKTLWVTDRPSMPYYDYAQFTSFEQVNDVLLIYDGQNQIDAFDIYTGNKLWHLKQKYGSDPLVVKGLLVVYGTNDVISILNPKNGQLMGTVKLERKPSSIRKVPTFDVALAGYENILAIAYTNTNELIALKIDFPKIE